MTASTIWLLIRSPLIRYFISFSCLTWSRRTGRSFCLCFRLELNISSQRGVCLFECRRWFRLGMLLKPKKNKNNKRKKKKVYKCQIKVFFFKYVSFALIEFNSSDFEMFLCTFSLNLCFRWCDVLHFIRKMLFYLKDLNVKSQYTFWVRRIVRGQSKNKLY